MANKMLIDATHAEETRVVVCKGQRVEEFDLESQERRQLRGNIYLAKVTRVEPSLQAAFVDYGGNRHGFLAFSEIHPDYHQIPVSDRQELLKEAANSEALANESEAGDEAEDASEPADQQAGSDSAAPDDGEALSATSDSADDALAGDDTSDEAGTDEAESASASDETDESEGEAVEAEALADSAAKTGEETGGEEAGDKPAKSASGRRPRRRRRSAAADTAVLRENAPENGDEVESVGAEDALEELPDRQVSRRRQYKIQEVIRRRQILLVQVVKEERGSKGAALTTYLSLAGRYCVLMPNTARGGGISRKITNLSDRQRLKTIAGDLKVAEGTGVIVRTAGANRTKAEIKRDFEYLQRLWVSIRDLTLKSTAPSLIYEEGSLIKRSIRDLYNKDIEEVVVEGDEGYREAKAFMRMLMPSHARHVKQYKEGESLFVRHRIESQFDEMFSPAVTLKSGGYLVIDQTEALVAIDVNSGKSTREHNVEDTAFQTNLEAAAEVARQLRLRDLAGLVVVDFIDMEERRNNLAVERKIKECLKTDRARIQVGRISHFGLLEMSRQRIRASVIEGTMEVCSDCQGAGRVRSVGSTALQIVRSLEEMASSGKRHNLNVTSRSDIALYMLNRKRTHINEIEARYGIEISIAIDETLHGSKYTIERGTLVDDSVPMLADTTVQVDTAFSGKEDGADEAAAQAEGDSEAEAPPRKRRRRRGRKRSEEAGQSEAAPQDDKAAEIASSEDEDSAQAAEGDGEAPRPKSRRRRGRRGGRRQRRGGESTEDGASPQSEGADAAITASDSADAAASADSDAPAEAETEQAEAPKKPRARRADAKSLRPAIAWPWQQRAAPQAQGDDAPAGATASSNGNGQGSVEPALAGTGVEDLGASQTIHSEAPAGPAEATTAAEASEDSSAESKPQRRGWWQRRSSAEG